MKDIVPLNDLPDEYRKSSLVPKEDLPDNLVQTSDIVPQEDLPDNFLQTSIVPKEDLPKSLWEKTKDVVKDSAKQSFKVVTEQTPFGIPIAICETAIAPIAGMAMEGATGLASISPPIVGAKRAYDVITGKKTVSDTFKESTDPKQFLNTSKEIIDIGHNVQSSVIPSKVNEFLQPKTTYGKALTKGVSYPLEKAHELAEDAQDYWETKGHYKTGFVNKMLLESAPYLIPFSPKLVKMGKIRGTSPVKIASEIAEAKSVGLKEPSEYIAGRVPLEDLPEGLKPKQAEGFPEGFSVKKVSTGLVNAYGDKTFQGYEYEVTMPDGVKFTTGSLKSAKEYANEFKNIVDSIQKKSPQTITPQEISQKLGKPNQVSILESMDIKDPVQQKVVIVQDVMRNPQNRESNIKILQGFKDNTINSELKKFKTPEGKQYRVVPENIPIEEAPLIEEAKKYKSAEEFVMAQQGKKGIADKFHNWDISQGNFEIVAGNKYPTRGWFDVARDFYNQAVKGVKEVPPKEPWQMTREEFIQSKLDTWRNKPKGKLTYGTASANAGMKIAEQANKSYEKIIQQALSEGKPVSPEVLIEGPGAQTIGSKETPTSIEQLTASLKGIPTPKVSWSDKVVKEVANWKDRMASVRDSFSKEGLVAGLNKIKELGNRTIEWYKNEPPVTEYKKILGGYFKDKQLNSYRVSKYAEEIKRAIPKNIREAVSSWLEADGDLAKLRLQEKLSSRENKASYADAQKLTPDQITFAKNIRNFYDTSFERAKEYGVSESFIENYVNHLWDRNIINKKQRLSILNNFKTNPTFANKRLIESFFEGEQKGKKAIKDIGELTAIYQLSLEEAISARKVVKSLMGGKTTQGEPLVTVGKVIGITPEGTNPFNLVIPNIVSRGLREKGYVEINHPAFKGWDYAFKDEAGKVTLGRTNLLASPDIARSFSKEGPNLKNILGRSAIREYTIGRFALNVSQIAKSTILSLIPAPFHQVHLGVHAIGHKVNPLGNALKAGKLSGAAGELIGLKQLKTLDEYMSNPEIHKGMQSGLMMYSRNALNEFADGLAAQGLVNKVPVLGQISKAYGEYLFQDYIPRLKGEMFLGAVERNTKRYGKKLTPDQIYEMSAKQSNAAFGELNYNTMGRNKTLQDVLRLSLLAPDFLEARGRFLGAALKPLGREQSSALIRVALGMYGVSRIFNALTNNGDPRWDKPFSVVVYDKEYTLRSIMGDAWHLVADPRSFVYNRLNPITTRTVLQLLSKGYRDEFGRVRTGIQVVEDVARREIPIILQGTVSQGEKTALQSMLGSAGVTSWKAMTDAEKEATKRQSLRFGGMGINEEKSDFNKIKKQVVEKLRKGEKLDEGLKEKFLNLPDGYIKDTANELPLSKMSYLMKTMTIDDAIEVWKNYMTAQEREETAEIFLKKAVSHIDPNSVAGSKYTPEQRKKLMQKIVEACKSKPKGKPWYDPTAWDYFKNNITTEPDTEPEQPRAVPKEDLPEDLLK